MTRSSKDCGPSLERTEDNEDGVITRTYSSRAEGGEGSVGSGNSCIHSRSGRNVFMGGALPVHHCSREGDAEMGHGMGELDLSPGVRWRAQRVACRGSGDIPNGIYSLYLDA